MKTKPIYIIAATAFLSTAALAQQTPPTTPQPMPNAQVTPPAAGSSAATTTMAFISNQRADQFLANDLIGTTVYGAGNETLGEINDLLVEPDGSVSAAVIGVGGFLGVGEKNVAVPFQMVEKMRNASGQRLVLRKTKDELKSAPTFTKYDGAPAATGSVSGTRPATPPATAR